MTTIFFLAFVKTIRLFIVGKVGNKYYRTVSCTSETRQNDTQQNARMPFIRIAFRRSTFRIMTLIRMAFRRMTFTRMAHIGMTHIMMPFRRTTNYIVSFIIMMFN
jgi:hypothetical protein